MIVRSVFIANLQLIERCKLPPGAFVECGTWRGGMSAALMEVGGRDRDYAFFDSFAGLPPAGAIDGPLAAAWQADIYSPRYYANCSASLEQFQATIAKTGFADKARVYPGWFDDTFMLVDPFPVACLRIDVDWYKPTFMCLAKFWDMLVPQALVLFDDYYVWPGSQQAVDVFLAQHAPEESVCHYRFGGASVAYLIKP